MPKYPKASLVQTRTKDNGKTQIIVSLPVLEVDSAEEADVLLAFTCSKDRDGEFTARELEQHPVVDRFIEFQRRIEDAYAVLKRKRRKKK